MSRFLSQRFASLEAYTPGEQPQDMQYVKLNTNESPFPPSPGVTAAVAAESGRLQLYSDPENTGEYAIFVNVSGMKNIHNFTVPNGNKLHFGHMFGTMDITYHNKNSVNHADVGGWAGDIVDLLSTTDEFGTGDSMTFEEKVAYIS